MAWTKDDKLMRAFYAGALDYAKAHGLLPGALSPNDVYDCEPLDELISSFIAERQGLALYDRAKDAGDAFKSWVLQKMMDIAPELPQTVKVEIGKTFGGVSVSFGWSGVFDLENTQQLEAAFRSAVERVEHQFEWFERSVLRKMGSSGQAAVAAGGDNRAKFLGEKLLVEFRGEKRYAKIAGGQYSKFGVRVWPEVLADAGVNLAALGPGEHRLGRECVVELVEGKPRKVVEIL